MKLIQSGTGCLFRLAIGIGIGYGLLRLGLMVFLPIQINLSTLSTEWLSTLLIIIVGVLIFGLAWLIWFAIGFLVFKFAN
jgi:hypothetical protein